MVPIQAMNQDLPYRLILNATNLPADDHVDALVDALVDNHAAVVDRHDTIQATHTVVEITAQRDLLVAILTVY